MATKTIEKRATDTLMEGALTKYAEWLMNNAVGQREEVEARMMNYFEAPDDASYDETLQFHRGACQAFETSLATMHEIVGEYVPTPLGLMKQAFWLWRNRKKLEGVDG